MKHNTAIEWTHIPGFKGETWNPIVGCSLASPGCTNCYAMRVANRRLDGNPKAPQYAGTTKIVNGQPVWSGKIMWHGPALLKPLQWKKPRAIFVNSMGDLFHESVPDELIHKVFAVATMCQHHKFIILTKRAHRMRQYIENGLFAGVTLKGINKAVHSDDFTKFKEHRQLWPFTFQWPLPNVWLGVSVEDQKRAEERIPHLLSTPAKVRFLSCEPLIGPVELKNWLPVDLYYNCFCEHCGRVGSSEFFDFQLNVEYGDGDIICPDCNKATLANELPGIDWVIAGGESGPGARAPHPEWFKRMQRLCNRAKVPFFFKQWGEWQEGSDFKHDEKTKCVLPDGRLIAFNEPAMKAAHIQKDATGGALMRLVGKTKAGRLLNDQEYNGFPECITEEL